MIFEKYESYKDSDVDWIGYIPNDWKLIRNKDIFAQISDKSIQLEKNTYIPLENIEQFTGKLIKRVSNENKEESLFFKKYDILFNKLRPYLAKVLLAEFNGGVSQEVIVMRVKNICKNSIFPKYFLYRFLSESFISKSNSMTDGVKMPRANPYKIMNLNISLPQNEVQTKIANYLDIKTKKIDDEITLLEQKIIQYKELKQTLINETVLRGLDKSVELKDSGIEWIGNIPKHWDIKRMKDIGYLYSGLSGKSGDDFRKENDELNKSYIPFTNIANNKYINICDVKEVIIDKNEKQNKVKKDDLFFLMSSEGYEDIGKSSLLLDDVKDVYLNSFCKGFRITKQDVDAKYINYSLSSLVFRNLMILGGKGFTRINLKIEKINDFIIIKPPLEEQIKIANYLDEKTQKLDQITKIIKDKIDVLKEFRKTLINDVVTGKVKVEDEI